MIYSVSEWPTNVRFQGLSVVLLGFCFTALLSPNAAAAAAAAAAAYNGHISKERSFKCK